MLGPRGVPAGGPQRFGRCARPLILLAALIAAASPGSARAQGETDGSDVPRIVPSLPSPLVGKRITRVEIVSSDPQWPTPAATDDLTPGEPFTPAAARRASHGLVAQGTVAEVTIDAVPDGDGVLVRLLVVPQRQVAEVRVTSDLDVTDTLRTAGVERGRAVTPTMLRDAERTIVARARARGFAGARVRLDVRTTDDPRTILVVGDATSGPPTKLAGVRVEVRARSLPELLREQIGTYGLNKGDRADDDDLSERDRALTAKLRAAGHHRASVTHRLYEVAGRTYALVDVRPGSLVRVRYEGNASIDESQLDEVLDLEKENDRSPGRAAQKIRDEYHRLGFLDAEVSATTRGDELDALNDLVVTIRENARVRVAARRYPCITGERTARDVGSEIDSYLEEELPGATLFSAVDPGLVDESLGPGPTTGARPAPLSLNPRTVYAPETYERALKHVQDLYRSEGYLTALVGPPQVIRRRCDPASKAGTCKPIPLPEVEPRCAVDAEGVPLEEPPLPPEMLCRPNRAKGIACEPRIFLRIPVKPGPQAMLYDVAFDGALAIAEPRLLAESGLVPGAPASNVKIEEGRKKILDAYRDEGFAFAEVTSGLDLSPDKQRARVRFAVLERQRVTVDRIVFRGNYRTLESVIRARLRFAPGDYYRQSDVRRSEELIATLGTFSSVTIGLEDPSIPATRKTVVVSVVERDPQYLELRPGVSTGEGVRGLLEYGHRNLGGRAISFTMRVQLNYLPSFLIPEASVRDNFDRLPLEKRLERRNTVGVQFPNVFAPTIRFGVDFVDVRSNSRDFGLTKRALLPTLTWNPVRQITASVGMSVERNDVGIFDGQSVNDYLLQKGISNDLSRLLRVPDGETTALAERVTAVWDRRDNPLGATRGTLVAASVEHVRAYPAEDNPNTITSDFVRLSGRGGGYVRLSKRGLTLAMLLGGGYNRQLISGSKTYPDRLFFLGGVDTIRGFARDSLLPQDLADQVQADAQKPSTDPARLTIDKIAIRGGDVYLNPRTELRIPVFGGIETALFVDGGNLWVDPTRVDPFRLRYAGGSGLRIGTPIGPVAFDYGINLNRRAWEDFGAFHFSIGLF